METKSKIIKFPSPLSSSLSGNSVGEIINLKSKQEEKTRESLVNSIHDSTSNIIFDLEELYEYMKEIDEPEFKINVKNILQLINELEEFNGVKLYSETVSIDIINFKLGIISECCHYFSDLFDELYDNDIVDLEDLPYYYSLVKLYIKYINEMLLKDDYDYNNYKSESDKQKRYIWGIIDRSSVLHRTAKIVNWLLEEYYKKEEFKDISEKQEKEILALINKVLKKLFYFDRDSIEECFNNCLDYYIESGIFKTSDKEELKIVKQELRIKIDKCIEYYLSRKLTDDFLDILSENEIDNKKYLEMAIEIKALENIIEDSYISGTCDLSTYRYVNKFMMQLLDKYEQYDELNTDMFDLDDNCEDCQEKPLEDSLIIDSFLGCIRYLHDVFLVNGTVKKSFVLVWKEVRSEAINKLLSREYLKQLFIGNNNKFYVDNKELIRKAIDSLSVYKVYVASDMASSVIEKEFSLIMKTLFAAYELGNCSLSLGLDNIHHDISKLDLLDFDNYTYVIRYLNIVDDIYKDIQYDEIIEFINSSVYRSLNISYNDKMYQSIYESEDRILAMDECGYYLFNKKDIKVVSIQDGFFDNEYMDKSYTIDKIKKWLMCRYDYEMHKMSKVKKRGKKNG